MKLIQRKIIIFKINEEQTIQELLTETISKLGENLIIKRLNTIADEKVYFQKYIHNSIRNSGKIGVLLTFKSINKIMKLMNFLKIYMHIAASDPKAYIQSLDKQLIEKKNYLL